MSESGAGLGNAGPPLDHSLEGDNSTSLGENLFQSILGLLPWCPSVPPLQHPLFQVSQAIFLVAFAAPPSRCGLLFMHSLLIAGFLVYSTWAWNVACARDVFSWCFAFTILNLGQTLYVLYQTRPVKTDKELESVYHDLFSPLNVERPVFKKLVSSDCCQVTSLHAGEAYAMQDLTRTDRLALLLSGKVNVLSRGQYLHSIAPMEFMDSPEFESSRASLDDKFKVSIVASTTSRYLFWKRSSLEYLFLKDQHLATVISTLVARDITTKLYSMNSKIVTESGCHLDIRLPSLTSSLSPALLEETLDETLQESPGHRHYTNLDLASSQWGSLPTVGEEGRPQTGGGYSFPQEGRPQIGGGHGLLQEGRPQTGGGYSLPQEGRPQTGGGHGLLQEGRPQTGGGYSVPQEGRPQTGDRNSLPQEGRPQTGGGYSVPQEGRPQTGDRHSLPQEGRPQTGGGHGLLQEGRPQTGGGYSGPQEGRPQTGYRHSLPQEGRPQTGGGYSLLQEGRPQTGGGYSVPQDRQPQTGSGYSVPQEGRPHTGSSYSAPQKRRPQTGGGYSVPQEGRPKTGGGHSVSQQERPQTGGGYGVPLGYSNSATELLRGEDAESLPNGGLPPANKTEHPLH